MDSRKPCIAALRNTENTHRDSEPLASRPGLRADSCMGKTLQLLASAPLVLAATLLLAPVSGSAQIPVTDGAQIANDNLLQNAMQKFSEEVMGKQYMQKMLSEETIKKYLADEVIKKQIGEKLLQPMVNQLSVIPGAKAFQGMVEKVVPGQMTATDRNFGELKTTTEAVLDGKHKMEDAVTAFFKGDTPPACPKVSGELTDNCVKARSALAAQLQEIRTLSDSLESRNNALRDMLVDKNYSSLAELQQKQYVMLTLQTIIANDNMRMQTAMAAYQNMRALYQEKYNEAVQARTNGGSGTLLESVSRGAIAAAGVTAGRAAAQQVGSNRIFGR